MTVRIPFPPEFIDANTATGQFVVERDRFVDGRARRSCTHDSPSQLNCLPVS